jgi:hypothetical protein
MAPEVQGEILRKKHVVRMALEHGDATLNTWPLGGLTFFFLFWVWDLNSGLHACKSGTLPFSHTSSILLWLFWTWGLVNYLPRLALNHNPPDRSLPTS